MTETTKEITRKLGEAIDSLAEAERKYMLGLAEGIALAKEKTDLVRMEEKENRAG